MYRKLLDWEWYQDANMVRVFLHLLLKANHQARKWRGITIGPGQLLSGRRILSHELGLSEQTIRSCIKKLISTNEITTNSTSQYTIFTINNWIMYQCDDLPTIEVTNTQPTANQQLTTNKNVKKEKNVKKFIKPSIDEVRAYCLERQNSVNPEAWIDHYNSNGWRVGKNPMKDWKAAVRTWERSEFQARPSAKVAVPKSKDLTNYGRN